MQTYMVGRIMCLSLDKVYNCRDCRSTCGGQGKHVCIYIHNDLLSMSTRKLKKGS